MVPRIFSSTGGSVLIGRIKAYLTLSHRHNALLRSSPIALWPRLHGQRCQSEPKTAGTVMPADRSATHTTLRLSALTLIFFTVAMLPGLVHAAGPAAPAPRPTAAPQQAPIVPHTGSSVGGASVRADTVSIQGPKDNDRATVPEGSREELLPPHLKPEELAPPPVEYTCRISEGICSSVWSTRSLKVLLYRLKSSRSRYSAPSVGNRARGSCEGSNWGESSRRWVGQSPSQAFGYV
jgi:hypothetical protein